MREEVSMSTSNTMLEVSRYENFAEINKENPSMNAQEIGLPEIMSHSNPFKSVFLNNPRTVNDAIDLDISLNDVEYVWKNAAQYNESGYISFKGNILTSRYEKELVTCRNIAKVFMPILLVEDNPNKFLKLALDYRKNKTVMAGRNQSQIEKHDVTNPCDNYYIGLDRIGQFLNFCVLLRQLPTTSDNIFKTTEQIHKLSFDRDVIRELVKQVDEEKKELDALISKDQMPEYQEKLNNYRKQYDEFTKNDRDGKESFNSWMTHHIRNDYELYGKNPDPKISDKNELNKLLRLDAYSKCKTSIETIFGQGELKNTSKSEISTKQEGSEELSASNIADNSKNISKSEINRSLSGTDFENKNVVSSAPLDTQTLNFFQELWNSLMSLINADEKHFYKEEKSSVELKENKIIPPKQPTENKIIPPTKGTSEDQKGKNETDREIGS